MSPTFTREQILALAPDAQVAHAGQSLAQAAKWQAAGQDESAAWGLHLGSGSAPYQVAVDYNGPAFKCSCPSRKRPCKHALGLFLLVALRPETAPAATRPDWVLEWSAGRTRSAERAEGKTVTGDAPEKTGEPAGGQAELRKQTSRQAQREKRVQEGVVALALWLEDLIRQGLGSAQGQSAGFWENQAARLVDAQAPGLARCVRDLASIPHSGEGWPDRMLHRLALLNLLLEGYKRIGILPPELQQEIRSQIGWTQDQDGLRAQPGVRDQWLVVAQRLTEEDRLRVQRTWLWGAGSRIGALVLDFAPPGRPIECALIPGTCLDAELVFWPGASRQRALVKVQQGIAQMQELPGYSGLNEALTAYGAGLAANPWLDRFLIPVTGVFPVAQGKNWFVRDGEGCCLPLRVGDADGWRLLGLSGGQWITVVGEWDGVALDPLSVWAGERLIQLSNVQPGGGHT